MGLSSDEKRESQTPTVGDAPTALATDETKVDDVENSAGTGLSQVKSASAEDSYITGPKLWLVLAAVALVMFLVTLDISILSTAIPQITSDFHRLEDVGWYVGAYLLASSTVQPLTGKMYTYFSTKWTFLIFVLIFEIGSAVCGSATSSPNFIAGRTIAGLGSSGLMNGGLTIIMGACKVEIRPMCTGIVMGLGQLGIILGPLIGGLFTEHVSWRWCFYINLPVGGVAALFLVLISVPDHVTKTPITLSLLRSLTPRFDFTGFGLFAPASVMILLALQFGSGTEYVWSDSVVIGLFVGGGVVAILFAFWEHRMGDDAMIPGEVIGRRIVLCSSLYFGLLLSSVIVGSNFLPIYLQSVKGLSPTMSGVYMLASILSQLLFIIISGALVTRLGFYLPWAVFAAAFTAVGAGLISMWEPGTSLGKLIGYQVVFGVRGAGIQMAVIAVQHELPPNFAAIGNSVVIFTQNFFGAVFITVANTVFQESLKTKITENIPDVDPAQAVAAGGSAEAVRALAPPGPMRDAILQVYSASWTNVFYLVVGVCVAAIAAGSGMGWVDVRVKKDHKKTGQQGGAVQDDEKSTTPEP